MRANAWTPEMLVWLDEHYGESDVHEVTSTLNGRFGCSKTETSVYVKANQRGLHRPRATDRRVRAARAIRWSCEPEMSAFMAENDNGSIPAAQEKFERRFGFRPTATQVSAWRMRSGRQSKAGRTSAQDWHRKPIGYERDTGKGYVLVKVREEPDVPGSKDNWEMKHVLVWERSRGLSLPKGWIVLFCDGDPSNLDPANLKAIPRALIGVMNNGPAWHDRETCEAAVALAMVKRGTDAAKRSRRHVCGVCGREFEPDNHEQGKYVQRTCRECLDKGLRSPRDYGRAKCPVCGSEFQRNSAHHAYCSADCRGEAERRRRGEREEARAARQVGYA